MSGNAKSIPVSAIFIFNEAADYDVSVSAPPGVGCLYFRHGNRNAVRPDEVSFSGRALRDFAILAGRYLRSEQKEIGEIRLASIFLPEHERVGKRVLANAAEALAHLHLQVWTAAV